MKDGILESNSLVVYFKYFLFWSTNLAFTDVKNTLQFLNHAYLSLK